MSLFQVNTEPLWALYSPWGGIGSARAHEGEARVLEEGGAEGEGVGSGEPESVQTIRP